MSVVPDKLVGIAGGSCSGKTSLEERLYAAFGDTLVIFPTDDLFVGMKALEGVQVDDWESPDLYRWDDFRHALHELKEGREVTIEANSRESTAAGIKSRILEPRSLVVVTGFLALHDEVIRSYYDETIFVDLPEDEIVRRRKARANPDSPWDSDDYIQNGLLPGHRRFVMPQREYAKHIVDGTASREALAAEVADIISG